MTLEYLEITEDMKKLKKQHRKQVAAVPPAPPFSKMLMNRQHLKILFEQNSRLVTIYQKFEVNTLKDLRQKLYQQPSASHVSFMVVPKAGHGGLDYIADFGLSVLSPYTDVVLESWQAEP